MELGVPVGIAEDQYQFIRHHEIMWTGSDVDFAAPMVEITKELFPDFCAASFDRGFHGPANHARLDERLDDNVLPKKSYLSRADREREQGETFAAMRRQHPAVESAINNLELRDLDRVRFEMSRGISPSGCFGRRCPERASPRTCAASTSAGTTSSRSLRQTKNERNYPATPAPINLS